MEVSVVTPTYHRRQFIPLLIQMYQHQTFPKEKMEWIILDDGKDSVEDLFKEASTTIPNIRYIHIDKKLRIGAKRNRLNDEANAPIIIAMDDDDYYPPQRVENVVRSFQKYPKVDLAGCSELYLYYLYQPAIYKIGPLGPNYATNGSMAWRKKYSNKHRYDEYVTHAEEVSFLENHKHLMIQMDPFDNLLSMCHHENTVDKDKLLKEHESYSIHAKGKMKLTKYSLSNWIKEPHIINAYLEMYKNK